MIPIPSTPAQHRSAVAVGRLTLPEGDLLVAGGEEAVEMPEEHAGTRLDRRHPRPPKRPPPGHQEPPGRPVIGGVPEVGQWLLKEGGRRESAIEGQPCLHQPALVPLQVGPPAQQQPPLASEQAAGLPAVPEARSPPGLVDRGGDMAQDVERVVHDPGVGQVGPQALEKRSPPVHADGPDAADGAEYQRGGAVVADEGTFEPHVDGVVTRNEVSKRGADLSESTLGAVTALSGDCAAFLDLLGGWCRARRSRSL